MKSLYFRIVATFALVALASGIIAFFISNLYYQAKLKDFNEEKILEIAEEIIYLHEHSPKISADDLLTSIANMNFQMYVVDEELKGKSYGEKFRDYSIDEKIVRSILRGNTYHGISQYKSSLFVTGFFKDEIENSIGVPIEIDGKTYALFVRPNIERQFGEMRIVFSLLLGITFLLSLLLILILTTFIVKPVKKLTKATRKIANGNYNIELESNRSDEIGDLAKDFSLMAKSLEKLDEMRQEFVSNVSHEIQSPLTSIKGFTKAIRTKVVSDEDADRYLEIIEKESERLSSLSKQLLMLSSLDKEVKGLEVGAFRLDEQIREAVLLTEWQWNQKKLNMHIDLPQLVIEGDKQLLFQVWTNLITNSIKFTDEEGSIFINAYVDDEIKVMIRDTGSGIAEEELPHIFDRFYMGDKSRDRTKSGSGLGLSVVKKIVDLHRGTIEVASKVGEGTTMTIRLPR
ncbi:sensor histidine kinase [Pseudogracilibacillus auburnensis]|uniref:sensor histidine kinase n=1 Tax=Pseudogracilibacillus auburnensis TaxID=1494959 RepID=UPI001A978157|nr:HAMP domain-containing sensor histidine kinase [Pseudogracilibacillus auburnensis]MBO1005709.1 HAMP domain-containing histidine kinase [Pseudogracilibacillus auburnensis]